MAKCVQCLLCGFEDESQIVIHINTKHDGLASYLLFFPFAHVINKELIKAFEENSHHKIKKKIPALDGISRSDKELILRTRELQKPERSQIIIEK